MDLVGSIGVRKRVRVKNEECYGTCCVFKKNTFTIKISETAFDDPVLFAETLLHELLHLWLFIVMKRCNTKMSEQYQHTIVNKIIPIVVPVVEIFLIRRAQKILSGRK